MSSIEAARIAAVLPLPKERGAIAPKGFTRRYGNTIDARIGVVARDDLDACVYKGATAPANKAPPKVTTKPRPLPGEEYETAKPPPPEADVDESAPTETEPQQNLPEPAPQPQTTNEATVPPAEPVTEPQNGI
jgi:monofunctional biosynthetic peptidoglycan transglycosylase